MTKLFDTTTDDCGVVDVPWHSLREAPADAATPVCEVRLTYDGVDFHVDSDITQMVDWFYVVSYERKLLL